MTLRAVFFGADVDGSGGRLRAPWRLLAFLFLLTLFTAVAGQLLYLAARALGVDTASWQSAQWVQSLAWTAGLLGVHALMLRLDRRPWASVALGRDAAKPRTLVSSWVLGVICIGVPSLLLMGVGWLAVVPAANGSWIGAALAVSLLLLPAALSEELFIRGYVFATLRESLGLRSAIALTSVAFGLLHLGNPGADARSVILVMLAGVFLAVVLVVTGSLYAAWMAHWGWNWAMAVPLHVSVSGMPLAQPDYRVVDAGPDWITGGPWGPEGGAAGAVGMLAGLAYLYLRRSTLHVPSNHESN